MIENQILRVILNLLLLLMNPNPLPVIINHPLKIINLLLMIYNLLLVLLPISSRLISHIINIISSNPLYHLIYPSMINLHSSRSHRFQETCSDPSLCPVSSYQ
jgi:hypothetical protein